MRKMFASFQCAALLAALVLPTLTSHAAAAKDRGPEFVPGELLVQFRAGVDESEKNRVLSRVNGHAAETVREAHLNRPDQGDLVLARVPGMMSVAAARSAVEEEPTVEFAEPNWIYTHQATSDDTYFIGGSLWGMSDSFGSQASVAWGNDKTDCSNVYVGIIDEGYMFTHTDLAGNSAVNPGEIAGNGADDDGNGYVDDVRGWDFANKDNSVFDGTTDDHGTHVAGTIGGIGGNGTGVAGVCWSVKLLSAKFLGRNGGTTANAVKAVDYFTDLKKRHGLNLVATNNSWGGGGFSSALQSAIERANAAGILFIAAAGNSTYNCETSNCYPGEYPNANVISVASITSSGGISSFSNYGSTTVDLGAPGSGIYSTLPVSSKGSIVSGYGSYSGTSMATPHVTGAAALYAAYNPGSTAAQIKSAILGSVTPTASLQGKTVTGGRLNVSGF
jgi:subtilisin family serine protease